MKEIKEDNKQSITIVSIIAMLFIAISVFLIVQNPDSIEGYVIYLLVIFFAILSVNIMEFYIKKLIFPDAVFLGNSKKLIYGSVIAGIIFSGVLGFASLSGATVDGYALYLPIQSVLAFSDLNNFFTLDVAPVGEALFFRGIMFPSMSVIFFLLLRKPLGEKNAFGIALALGMVTTAYIFGIFHFNVWLNQTGNDIVLVHDYITLGALFSMIWSVATVFVGIGFELGSHTMNNLMSMIGGGYVSMEEGFADLFIKLVMFVAIVELVYRGMKK